jgi:uncharacterized protein (TIGR02117 family)
MMPSRRWWGKRWHNFLHETTHVASAMSMPSMTAERCSKDRLLILPILLLVSACTATPVDHAIPSDEPDHTVLVIQHRWHTGIAVRRAAIPAGAWPESANYPHARYLEVGWGDRDFYPAPDPSTWAAVRAVLAPGPSVLHIVGLREHPAATFPFSDVVELRVGPDGFERLIDFIATSHDRGSGSPAEAIGPGLYLDSHFYPALGRFHLFYNCNSWTIDALRAAGLPMQWAITSEEVIEQAGRLGTPIGPAVHASPDS